MGSLAPCTEQSDVEIARKPGEEGYNESVVAQAYESGVSSGMLRKEAPVFHPQAASSHGHGTSTMPPEAADKPLGVELWKADQQSEYDHVEHDGPEHCEELADAHSTHE